MPKWLDACVVEREALLTSLRSNDGNPNYDRRAFGAWRGTECVGTALLVLPRRDNTRLAEIGTGVPPCARHRGVGRAMFEHLRNVARKEGRTVLAAEVDAAGVGAHTLTASTGGRFALACGFSPKHTELRLMLDARRPRSADRHSHRVRSSSCADPRLWLVRCLARERASRRRRGYGRPS